MIREAGTMKAGTCTYPRLPTGDRHRMKRRAGSRERGASGALAQRVGEQRARGKERTSCKADIRANPTTEAKPRMILTSRERMNRTVRERNNDATSTL